MKKEMFWIFCSYETLVRYITTDNRKYDLLFYILLIFQISILTSISSGFHAYSLDEWYGVAFSSLFDLLFYPILYIVFYSKKELNFIKDMAISSVVARIHSFIYVGILSVCQIGLWSLLKFQKIAHTSLIYYILYYIVFTILMVFMMKKRRLMILKK